MKDYALENARRARVISSRGRPLDPARVQNSLRIVHGVSEALPLEDASCDAVVWLVVPPLLPSRSHPALSGIR